MDLQPGADITSDDKLWALLSYILTPIVPIIVLLMDDKKSRPYIKLHAVQALAWGVIYWAISALLAVVFVGICTSLIGVALSIWWGIKAYQGQEFKIPVITDFVKKQGWA